VTSEEVEKEKKTSSGNAKRQGAGAPAPTSEKVSRRDNMLVENMNIIPRSFVPSGTKFRHVDRSVAQWRHLTPKNRFLDCARNDGGVIMWQRDDALSRSEIARRGGCSRPLPLRRSPSWLLLVNGFCKSCESRKSKESQFRQLCHSGAPRADFLHFSITNAPARRSYNLFL
jgi:hypothetical protein